MINESSLPVNLEFEILQSTYTENKNMPQMHYHGHYELLYVYHNSRTLIVGDKSYILDKNTVALIPPYIPHMTISGGTLPQERVLINFSESYVHEIRKALPEDILGCFFTPNFVINIENFIDNFCSCIKNLQKDVFGNQRLLELCQLLDILSSNTSSHMKNEGADIIRYVESNFSEKITLDILANKFYLSKFTISRYFSRYTGTTLPKYLNSIRIINAKRYLREGMKVTEVAFKCGFESTANFDRVFLASTGVSPSKFKKLQL